MVDRDEPLKNARRRCIRQRIVLEDDIVYVVDRLGRKDLLERSLRLLVLQVYIRQVQCVVRKILQIKFDVLRAKLLVLTPFVAGLDVLDEMLLLNLDQRTLEGKLDVVLSDQSIWLYKGLLLLLLLLLRIDAQKSWVVGALAQRIGIQVADFAASMRKGPGTLVGFQGLIAAIVFRPFQSLLLVFGLLRHINGVDMCTLLGFFVLAGTFAPDVAGDYAADIAFDKLLLLALKDLLFVDRVLLL